MSQVYPAGDHPNRYGEHPAFKQGLAFELGNQGSLKYKQALKAYRQGAQDGHYLSQRKVDHTKLRLITTLPLSLVSLIALIWGLLTNQFWIGSFITFFASLILYMIDYARYWYRIGFAYRFIVSYFYSGLLIFLPLSAILPYLNGVTYFPLVGLLVIGFFILAAGIILVWTSRSNLNFFISLYGFFIFVFSLIAYQIPAEDIKFSFIEIEGGVEITRYRSADPIVNIPEMLNNTPVIRIGANAFNGSGIQEVYIGDHIQSVGAYAFANNDELASVWIEDGVPLSVGMFYNTPSLTEIRLPETTNIIPSYAFYNAINLNTIVLPESLVSIGAFAFYQTGFSSIPLPESLQQLGPYAFSAMPNLTALTIPHSVIGVGEGLLANNPKIQSVTLSILMDTIPASFLSGASAYRTFTVPNHIKHIGDFAFENMASLEEFEFHTEIETLGRGLLRNATALSSLIIPEGITSIGDYFLTNARQLTSVILPSSLTSIGISAFQNNVSLTSIQFPNRLTSINTNAFSGTPLETIQLPASLTSLGDGAFSHNLVVKNIVIPSGVTVIPNGLFQGATALETVQFLGNITVIEKNAFRQTTSLVTIDFPASLTRIGSFAFFGSRSLVSLSFLEGLEIIEAYAFYGTESLRTIDLPRSLRRIEDGVFGLARNLISVWLNEDIDFVGHFAFFGCEAITIRYEGVAIPSTWMPSWNPDQYPIILQASL